MAKIYYARVEEFWRKGEKYAYLEEQERVGKVEWQELQADAKHNWLTEGMESEFDLFLPLGTKEAKSAKSTEAEAVFKIYSLGVVTNRDAYVYSFSLDDLKHRVETFIEIYNTAVERRKHRGTRLLIEDVADVNDHRIKWTRQVKASWERMLYSELLDHYFRTAFYRPFIKQCIYFDRFWNEEQYKLAQILPTSDTENENLLICLTSIGSEKPFMTLLVNRIPDLHLTGPGTGAQCFPFYTYNEDGTNRRENITDWALEKFREHYKDSSITKWDIFHYVYTLLHHPVYRERYAANLKRELPRIPFVGAQTKIFRAFAEAGARLAEIHVHYEEQPEYPLERVEQEGVPLNWRVEKMRLGKDKRSLRYNEFLTLSGIPQDAFEYRLGNRSALEWVIDQYQVSTDRRSGITNDPNRADDPTYIIRLVGQVITVSLETVEIVRSLPGLEIDEASTS